MELKPYTGYFPFLRAILYLFQEKSLDVNTLGIYIAFVSECDWDIRHPNCGKIKLTDEELAIKWGLNTATIWRYKKKLIKLGLMKKVNKQMYKLTYVEILNPMVNKILSKEHFADKQSFIAVSQLVIADVQIKIADLQSYRGQNRDQSFKVSSNNNLVSLSINDEDSVDPDDIPF